MSKSKRKNKKRRQPQPQVVEAVAPEQATEVNIPPESDYKTAILIVIVIVVTAIALYAMLATHNGGFGGQVSNSPSDQTSAQTGLPSVGSDNPNSLSPSGSVNLQPTSNATQAGSVQ
ncbi:hypothetical protein KW789_02560 [Candidatus Saccharibacteria bacterium]|nr:hypothetical protein [Candidatus Saccharibacteria bacterium]